MAQWWELVIPAASALGGVVATIGAQTLGADRQRLHDRQMRFLDDKRAAYADFLRTATTFRDETIKLSTAKDAIKSSTEYARKTIERMHLLTAEANSLTRRDPPIKDARFDSVMASVSELALHDLPEMVSRHLRAQETWTTYKDSETAADWQPKLLRASEQIHFLGSPTVRQAANAVISLGSPDKSNESEFGALIDAFALAARDELEGVRSDRAGFLRRRRLGD